MRVHCKALILISTISALVWAFGCSHEPPKRTVRPPDVTVAKPVHKEVIRYLEYTGTTAAIQYVDIRARVAGFLQKVCFEPRAKVKAGDLLFIIDPRQYEATVKETKAKLDASKAESKLKQTELQMAQQLGSKEAISGLRLEKSAAERDVAAADVELAAANLDRAKLDLEWTQVTSPIDGRVSRNLVDVGNLVGATEKTLLTTVVDDEMVYTYFNLSELDLLAIQRKYPSKPQETGQELKKIPAQLGLADETGYPHEGHLDFADTKVDPTTGTIQIRAVFPNPDGILMAGMFARVRVPVETMKAWLVPEVAVQFDQGGSYVLTVNRDNVVEQRRIKRGLVSDGMQAIEQGLTGEDTVIVSGLQRARPGSKVNPIQSAGTTSQPAPAAAEKPRGK
jgi:RND family efflux transporter MFP subunit